MGGWHRDNPELCGTDADPWMDVPIHRQAHDELRRAGLIYVEDDGPDNEPPREEGAHER